jgi:octaprenyl-diphosphate synthase
MSRRIDRRAAARRGAITNAKAPPVPEASRTALPPQPAAAPTVRDDDAPFRRLQALLADDMAAVDALMAQRMQSDHTALIPQVAAHLIGAGGKRLRPLLTLAAARLCGGGGQAAVLLAAAVEFIHNATLLHDDVVDESGKRRGRPTANAAFGNKPSVLVGDFLFARSFQLMVETGDIRVLDALSNAAAVIVEGEVLQLAAANSLAGGEDVYFQVIRGKTAALFEAATRSGAMVAGGTAAQAQALAAYGDALGIAFQIADDILDYGRPGADIGKNAGEDFREGKATLPVLIAHAAAREAGDADALAFWSRVIERREQREGDLAQAMALMTRAGAMDRARARAEAHAARAVESLSAFPAGALRDALTDLAQFVVARGR